MVLRVHEDQAVRHQRPLAAAGGAAGVLTSDANATLHEASSGRLRDLDRIATETLKRAARRKLKKVDRQLVQSALDTDSD